MPFLYPHEYLSDVFTLYSYLCPLKWNDSILNFILRNVPFFNEEAGYYSSYSSSVQLYSLCGCFMHFKRNIRLLFGLNEAKAKDLLASVHRSKELAKHSSTCRILSPQTDDSLNKTCLRWHLLCRWRCIDFLKEVNSNIKQHFLYRSAIKETGN